MKRPGAFVWFESLPTTGYRPAVTEAPRSFLIAGGGLFGLTAALELCRRGFAVTVVDPAEVPRADGASVDISKAVRLDYGRDVELIAWMEPALDGWRAWNAVAGERLFHETGVVFCTSGSMDDGGFERDCFDALTARGHRLERLDADGLAARFPDWRHGRYRDGYFNPLGGYADSRAVVRWLSHEVRRAGGAIRDGLGAVELVPDRPAVRAPSGEEFTADHRIVAAGAWTPALWPALAAELRPTAQVVVYLQVDDPGRYQRGVGCPWGADIATSGWFGFPATPDGIVKFANHGAGVPGTPDTPRVVPDAEIARFRAFLRDTFPSLAGAPLADAKICFYTDSRDGDFWVARDPERAWQSVASGGSGHAFKFAPVLGAVVADVAAGIANPLAGRFGWRRAARGREAARAR